MIENKRDEKMVCLKTPIELARDEIVEKLNKHIYELINRRRRQLLVHSVLYYRMNENLVSDSQWTAWGVELEELQKAHPDIAKEVPYADAFENFDHSSGYDLPLTDPWAVGKAQYLLELDKRMKGRSA